MIRNNLEPFGAPHSKEESVMKYFVIQKGKSRVKFIIDGDKATLQHEMVLVSGGTGYSEHMPIEKAREQFRKYMGMGFKRFRNAKEVNWYATIENNTPYKEVWKVEGDFLIPIESRSLA